MALLQGWRGEGLKVLFLPGMPETAALAGGPGCWVLTPPFPLWLSSRPLELQMMRTMAMTMMTVTANIHTVLIIHWAVF